MTKLRDLTGFRFNRWHVIERAPNDRHRNTRWHCRCNCGTLRIVNGANLTRGLSPSCGCLRKENNTKRLTTHGLAKSRIYKRWADMIQRCHNPALSCYPRYGGRGITVCKEWRESFAAFYAEMGEPPAKGMTIDRINNDRGYEPGNCRWSTPKEQANNTRRNHLLRLGDETLTLIQWAKRLNLSRDTIVHRLKLGWPIERVLSPVKYHSSGKPLPPP